ncbi:hypothetical protein KSP40_PGU013988 [Platanthera guangdongensis]|uniref:Secreted protein n=1 Tax=Platanthera guangdongensis TaxID=2320717 RepID=A0ABR2M8V9_9ASPA
MLKLSNLHAAFLCTLCGIQIVHRQVQEHAQTCPPLRQQVETAHTQALTASNHGVTPDSSASSSVITAKWFKLQEL